ncbi:TetR/AcrR family transcriptional regulator [Pelagibacterium xiamenense]|uniref:TetR/AcrR family transcriptional regulator n=1 Tax=Pelagibacterium xiamenense TaxID=2901140 RepID=UPI001E5C27D7|nr:TetR/AcrR family transcriptional regulator [Pelagibacterium xiamenense]MCD7061455.1 TetR/AcrR family transcriptional regulator [Pelagibacterium xiamenense]
MSAKATRTQIVHEADRLFYEQGFEHTSFSDIADAVGISRGNFYYHFKSKDEILDAVIGLRLAKTRKMLEDWEAEGAHPADRIRSFIRILMTNQSKIMRYGCPVGTLCAELAKLDHAMQDDAAGLFTLFRTWLVGQFEALGHREEADRLAMHLLARSQGVASLANAFGDADFIEREVDAMCGWLAGYGQSGDTQNAPGHH